MKWHQHLPYRFCVIFYLSTATEKSFSSDFSSRNSPLNLVLSDSVEHLKHQQDGEPLTYEEAKKGSRTVYSTNRRTVRG